jgi:hypothetical protein
MSSRLYLAGVSVRRVEDITEALWGTRVSPATVSDLNKKIALDQPRLRLCLHHAIGAAAAGIFGANGAQHPQDRRDHVEHFVDIFADLVELTLATGTRRRLRLDHLLATGENILTLPA